MGTQTRTSSAIPPELRAAPPRRARRYRRKWAVLLLLPYISVGAAAAAFLAAELLFIFATPAIPGRITQLYVPVGRGGASYRVQYQYISDSTRFIGSDGVSPTLYNNLSNGMEVRIHAISIGPRRFSEMEKPFSEYYRTRWALWALAIVWNILLVLHLRVRAIPRRLVERGTPVIGRITEKQVFGRDSATAKLRFTFNASDGRSITALEGVAAWRCQKISDGDPVVVLYDPGWPRRAILYDCSDFLAV